MEIITRMYDAVFAPVNTTSSFDTATNLFSVFVLIAIAVGVLTILLYASSSFERFKRFKRLMRIFRVVYKSLNYFAYGSLTIAVIGGPILFGWYAVETAQDNAESILPLFKWVAVAFGIYVGVTLVGYATKKRIWKRIGQYRKMDKVSKEAAWFENNI